MDCPVDTKQIIQTESNHSHPMADRDDRPINLIVYLLILWRHKGLFLFCLFLPMVLLGVTYLLSENDYQSYLRYDIRNWDLTQEDALLLMDRFYANASPVWMVGMSEAEFMEVRANIWPKLKPNSAYRPAPDNKAEFLEIAFSGGSREHLENKMAVIRRYFEQFVQLYSFRESLLRQEINWRSQITLLEEEIVGMELQIEIQKALFERFSGMSVIGNEANVFHEREWIEGQFDLGQKTEFLPISYQIRAAQIRIAQLEEEREGKKVLRSRYDHMLSVIDFLLTELCAISSDNTLDRLHDRLVEILNAEKDETTEQFLSSFRRNVENRITSFQLAVPGPVSLIALDRLRIGFLTLIGALVLSVVVVLLWEGIRSSLREKAKGL